MINYSKIITVKILRSVGLKKECANGYSHNLGNHQTRKIDTGWKEMDYQWQHWCRANIGRRLPWEDFRSIYIGLLMVSGFSYEYAKKMSEPFHIKNGAAFAEFIELEYETVAESETVAA